MSLGQEPRDLCGQGNIVWEKRALGVCVFVCVCVCVHKSTRAGQPHSNVLAWEIPWTEEPGKLQPMGSQELDMT